MSVPRRHLVIGVTVLACGCLVGLISCGGRAGRPVTYDRLVQAAAEPAVWLTFSGTYDGQRFSRLTQIDRTNVSRLRLKWSLPMQTAENDKVEATPLVADGIMYFTRPPSDVIAADAADGRVLWEFRRPISSHVSTPAGRVNRGVALLGDRVYVTTFDGHLIALDRYSGSVRWDVQVADASRDYSITGAPLAVKNMIVTGAAVAPVQAMLTLLRGAREQVTASGRKLDTPALYAAARSIIERPGTVGPETPEARGYIDAYDATSGTRLWRFSTVPGPGERGHETWAGDSWRFGGASPWMTGSYDPTLNLLYWGVGNPNPWPLGDLRRGDNLYSSSLVALDPDSGRLKWHFQFTPHDVHDWDAAQVPVLADLADGLPRQVVMTANRNGFFYVLDRATGKFVRGRAFARQDWAEGLDRNGRPIVSRNAEPTYAGNRVSPSMDGATSWWAPAFNPTTRLFYLTTQDATETYRIPDLVAASRPGASLAEARRLSPRDVDRGSARTQVRAIDPTTGVVRWEFALPLRSTSGLLTTATGLVFFGSTLGDFWAVDANTGTALFATKIEGFIHAAPISYEIDGVQIIAVASRSGIWAFSLQ